jgi:oligoendopeptidase F
MMWSIAMALGAEGSRVEVRWQLEDIFPSVEAWEQERARTEGEIRKLGQCKGKLGQDAQTLLTCLEQSYAVRLTLGRLSSYAGNHASGDTRDDAWQSRTGAVQLLQTSMAEAMSWFGPELVALGPDKVDSFLAAEPKLAPYAYPLKNTLRRAAHVRSPAEERILALSSAVTGASGQTYTVLANAELPWPTVTIEGQSVKLSQAEYSRWRAHPDPAVRKLVFDTFFGTLSDYEATMGGLLAAQVSAHWFMAQSRAYPSSVEAALAGDFVPRAVYDTLIREANANLPTLHRYFKLRASLLGLDKLAYSDLYVPMVASELKFSLEESQRLAAASAKPLGADYVSAMEQGFRSGWTDAYPREGKISGAYMSDEAYGVHPFVLLNHNDDYESASTLAHEFGHAMHSHLAMSSQPYPTASYSIFLAEVASTFNEALLAEHMLSRAKTDEDRLFYLGETLERLRATFFRQAMFGEYELAIHEKVEKGEPLTGGTLTAMYADVVRRYHGHDQGIVQVDDVWTHEWQYIPHFYYDFYVYQYATSLAAASLLARDVLDKKKGATERYLGLLRAGGSDDPYVLLKNAGVDLATPEPYRAVAARMEEIMDQIEAIQKKQAKKKR